MIAELGKLAFANIADFIKVGADGQPRTDFAALTRDQAAALTEVIVDELKAGRGAAAQDVRRVRFKLADKRAALSDLCKLLGLFRDNVEHAGKDVAPAETRQIDDFEAARRIAFLLAKATVQQQTPTPTPDSSPQEGGA